MRFGNGGARDMYFLTANIKSVSAIIRIEKLNDGLLDLMNFKIISFLI